MTPSLPFLWHFSIYCWQDVVEIILLSGCIYYFSLWLYSDKHKPLLTTFYGYCFTLLATHFLALTAINHLLIIFMPIACAVFILIHQTTLQKNFITLHRITPLSHPKGDYLEHILRTALTAVSNNQPFTCVIEKQEAIDPLVHTAHLLQTPCTQEMLQLITTSTLFDPHAMIWITTHENIQAYNVSWKKNSLDQWFTKEVHAQEPWLQEALFFTTKTDAIFIYFLPKTRTCTLIAQGKIIEQASAQHAFTALKTYLGYQTSAQKGDWYVPHFKNSSSERTFS